MGLFNTEIKERINKTRNRAREIDSLIASDISNYNQTQLRIKEAEQGWKDQILEDRLKQVSVDKLNFDRDGIRVSALKNASYNNICQLKNITYSQLVRINGIGEDSAKKILSNIQKIIQRENNDIHVKIDYDHRNYYTNIIVMEVYMFIRKKEYISELIKADKHYTNNIVHDLNYYDYKTNSIKWLFTSTTQKEQIKKDLDELICDIDVNFCNKSIGLRNKLDEIRHEINHGEHWEHFLNNAATYYAYLDSSEYEELIPASDTKQKKKIYGDSLATELVDEINALSIDLSHMNSVLRRYQTFGVKYILSQERVLLGDEMGLGKTVQAIAAISHLKSIGKRRFIVVCPLSVMVNWQREIEKHSDMKAVTIHGYYRDMLFASWKHSEDIAITTYETLGKVPFSTVENIDMMIVDEAHNVKNPNAFRTQAVEEMVKHSEYVLYMTGTPLENRIDEMKHLINVLNPDVGNKIKNVSLYANPNAFKKAIMPVYLRRIREDVLEELPELVEIEDWVTMNEKERKVYYDTLLSRNFMSVRRISWNAGIPDSSKAKRLLEICDDAREEHRKVLVFSYFRDTLSMVHRLLQDRCIGEINGSVSSSERQRLIDEFTNAESGSVLISQVEAGGIGLNIQAASVIIFCEPQFKPSTENQAVSRAYRMGQTRNVMVHRLLVSDSIDERIMKILEEKTKIFNAYADESLVGTKDIQINEHKFMEEAINAELLKYENNKNQIIEQDTDADDEDFTENYEISNKVSNIESKTEMINNLQTQVTETNVFKTEQMERKKETMFDEEKGIYPEGSYLVGEDIPKGSYILTAKNGKTGSLTTWISYKKFKEDEPLSFYNIEDDFHISFREDGMYFEAHSVDIKMVKRF